MTPSHPFQPDVSRSDGVIEDVYHADDPGQLYFVDGISIHGLRLRKVKLGCGI